MNNPSRPAERLRQLPISAFAMVMGMTGLAIAWKNAASDLSMPVVVGDGVIIVAVVVFVILVVLYLAKAWRHGDAVREELADPGKRNYFSAVTIGLMLMSIAWLPERRLLSWYLWITGASGQLALTLWVVTSWIDHTRYEITQINPTWFIPAVGNIMVPIAGIHHAAIEISWFCFSIGLLFWVILVTIIFYRMIFHDPIIERRLPTMFILIAPPAVGFVSYVSLTGEFDGFARVLYYAALFLTLMLLTQAHRFGAIPFTLSWWAYSFPMAAITIATTLVYSQSGIEFFRLLSLALLALLSVIMATLVVRTLIVIHRGEFADVD